MKTRKARGQVRRFFRRGIACLLALTGVAMAAVNAGVPLDWLGNLAAIPTASAAQETPSSDEPVPLPPAVAVGGTPPCWPSGPQGPGTPPLRPILRKGRPKPNSSRSPPTRSRRKPSPAAARGM